MKQFMYGTVVCLALMFVLAPSARAQTLEIEGYTVIRAGASSIICLGRWSPSKEAGRPGSCDGQLADVSQLTAISSRQTADRLDQLLPLLESIDRRLADNTAQIERLIEATINTQTSINRQAEQFGELMHDTVSSRIDALSKRVLANEAFRKELEKMKQDILTDIKKHYPAE